jgi:DHA1 family inner membrane transport protein
LVSIFAVDFALAAPVLSALTADWSRRSTLITSLAAFTFGNAITALVPGFGLVLGARVIAAAGAGLFTANANATAALLAGSQNRGKAIALVLLGLTSSLVFGAPLGAAIGNAVGWRMTIWIVTALGLCAGGVVFLRLPNVREGGGSALAERLTPLRNRAILYYLLRALVVFTGIYIPYTYISVVYSPVTRAAPQWLSLFLFAFGVAGTVGNLLAGRLADRFGPLPVMIVSTVGLVATFLLVPFLNSAVLSAAILAGLSGLFSFALNAPQQHFLISHAHGQNTSLVMSLYQSTLYAAVSLSGALGAFAIKANLGHYLTLLSVAPLCIFILMTWLQTAREKIQRRAEARLN